MLSRRTVIAPVNDAVEMCAVPVLADLKARLCGSQLSRVAVCPGWRREVVYRFTQQAGDDERRADSYYYTPTGKKLRSLREISAFREC